MIDRVLYQHIAALPIGSSIYYGSAEKAVGPYYVMMKVADPERQESLCQSQGDSGRALFQFSGYAGGAGANAANAATTLLHMETLKNIVNKIRGVIGTAPMQYRIWQNMTTGARILEGNSQQIWGAMFETEIWWEKV